MTATPDAQALLRSVERLEQVILDETAALSAGRGDVDFAELNRLKSLGLLELTRLGRDLDGAPSGGTALDSEGQAALARLRDVLEENARALQLHVRAASEIAELVTGALRDAESDGTYGRSGASC